MKVIIVGGGQVGAYLAALLIERGHEIKIMDTRDIRIPILKRDLPESCVIHADGTEPQALEAAGIRGADVVAAVTGADETNLVAATLARMEYGVRRVVGRVNNPKNAWLFNATMGVDAALNQADLMARLVAEEMTMGDMMTLLKLHGGQYSLVERVVDPGSMAAGKTLKDIKLPGECMLVAILRGSELLLPRGETVLLSDDKVVAIVHASCLQTLADMLGPNA
ncbi:MAG TPA: TrkA family potassium uptake protein [Clostridia bacterium]|nr:TrkA family potassium uptake protein [Clostridia bacterium]